MSSRRQFITDLAGVCAALPFGACHPAGHAAPPITPSSMHSIRSGDGTLIAYSRTGSGDALVLVHGTSGDRNRWKPLVPQLESRFTVYAMDRRGRGESGDNQPYSLEREFEDVAAVVDSIGGPAYLLGHSHGAICALGGAQRAKSVKRLVLYEPPINVGTPIYDPAVVARLRERLQANDREDVLRTFFTKVVRMPPHELEKMESMPSWRGRVAAAHTVVREIEISDSYRIDVDGVRRFRVPTLLMLGGDSPSFFRLAIEKLAATLPDNRVVVMPGQQHIAMDTAPDLFLREVMTFLTTS